MPTLGMRCARWCFEIVSGLIYVGLLWCAGWLKGDDIPLWGYVLAMWSGCDGFTKQDRNFYE
jgi:hypothetical protein